MNKPDRIAGEQLWGWAFTRGGGCLGCPRGTSQGARQDCPAMPLTFALFLGKHN